MPYIPELNQQYSGALRRIAWALKMPMSKALMDIFDHVGRVIEKEKVCASCQDRTFCEQCMFCPE